VYDRPALSQQLVPSKNNDAEQHTDARNTYAKHVAVERASELIERRAAPLARLKAPRGARRQRRVEARYAQIRVRDWGADALHVAQVGRRIALRHAQRGAQLGREHAGSLRRQLRLELASLVVEIAERRQTGWFALVLEERVVQHLVVDVHFAEFRCQLVATFEFQLLGLFTFDVCCVCVCEQAIGHSSNKYLHVI
jgi:hypothetical protein